MIPASESVLTTVESEESLIVMSVAFFCGIGENKYRIDINIADTIIITDMIHHALLDILCDFFGTIYPSALLLDNDWHAFSLIISLND